jgi:hypothetical protein
MQHCVCAAACKVRGVVLAYQYEGYAQSKGQHSAIPEGVLEAKGCVAKGSIGVETCCGMDGIAIARSK